MSHPINIHPSNIYLINIEDIVLMFDYEEFQSVSINNDSFLICCCQDVAFTGSS